MQQYQHVQEDSTLHIHGVEIVDVDSEIGGYGELHVKISSLHGKVQLFKHEGLRLVQGSWDSGSGLMDFFGNIDDANEALKEMKYTPDLNYNSDIGEIDNISFFVSDMNQTGGHIEFTHEANILVHINPVNDPPVISLPGATYDVGIEEEDKLSYRIVGAAPLYTDEDTPLFIEGVLFEMSITTTCLT